MPEFIHQRAKHISAKNPSMPESEAWAIATQQSHALGKSPKGYGTTEGRYEAKEKYTTPKDDKKAANPGHLESAKIASMRRTLEELCKQAAVHAKHKDVFKSLVRDRASLEAEGRNLAPGAAGYDVWNSKMRATTARMRELMKGEENVPEWVTNTAHAMPNTEYARPRASAHAEAAGARGNPWGHAAENAGGWRGARPDTDEAWADWVRQRTGRARPVHPDMNYWNKPLVRGAIAAGTIGLSYGLRAAFTAHEAHKDKVKKEQRAERAQIRAAKKQQVAQSVTPMATVTPIRVKKPKAVPVAPVPFQKAAFATSPFSGPTGEGPRVARQASDIPPFVKPAPIIKRAFQTSQFSGPLSMGSFKMVSHQPGFQQPQVSVKMAPSAAMAVNPASSAPMVKRAWAGMGTNIPTISSPKSVLSQTKRVGGAGSSPSPGPSIASQVKPVNMGKGSPTGPSIAGATKS